jgi:transcriptional regulator with XRE-family HTH domain
MFTSAQLRMARAALGLSAQDLADAAAVDVKTVLRFEREEGSMLSENMARVQAVLEKRGIVFLAGDENRLGGPGIRYNKK